MLTRGVPSDVILLAIETVEVERDASRDVSRSVTIPTRTKAAIRAERYRNKLKQNQPSAEANDAATAGSQQRDGERDASRDGVTKRCDLSSSLASLSGFQEVKKESKSARGTRLSPAAVLPVADRQFAIDHHVSDPDALWAEFVDFWIGVPGQRGKKLNWSATWRNRVRAVASKGKPNGQNNVLAASSRLIERIKQFDAPAPGEPSRIRSGEGGLAVPAIPHRTSE